MKLESYTPQVSGNVIHGNISSPNLLAAFGGDTSGMNALAGALGKAAETLQAQWIKGQNDNVIDANNEYQRRINDLLYNEETGLTYTMQGKNAENLQAAYIEAEKKIRAEVADKYKINNKYAVSAFEKQIDSFVTTNLDSINKFQRKEHVGYINNQSTEDALNTQNAIMRTPDSTSLLMGDYLNRDKARMAGLGMDDASINIELRKKKNAIAKDSLDSLTKSGDNKAALSMIKGFREQGVDEAFLKPLEQSLTMKVNSDTLKTDLQKWAPNHPEVWKMTPDEAYALFRKDNPFNRGLGKVDLNNVTVEQALAAIGDGESSGDYNAYNGSFDTKGKYQFDQDTWNDECTKYMGLDAPLEMTPENQEKVAKHMMGRYLKAYGLKGAAVAWYGGEGLAQKYLANPDSPAWDRKQPDEHGVLKYPSVNEYINGKIAYLSGSGHFTEEELKAQEENDKLSFIGEFRTMQKERKEQIYNAVDNIRVNLQQMAIAGSDAATQLAFLKQEEAANPELGENHMFLALKASLMQPKNTRSSGSGNGSGNGYAKVPLKNITARIGVDILSRGDLEEVIKDLNDEGYNLSPEDINTLVNNVTNYTNGEGEYAYSIPEDKSEIKSITGLSTDNFNALYPYITQIVRQKAAEFKKANGRYPDYAERKSMYAAAIVQHTTGMQEWRGLMKYDLTISDVEAARIGIKNIRNSFDDKAIEILDDQGVYHYVPYEDFEAIKNGDKSLRDY